jgi:hypothetical protein
MLDAGIIVAALEDLQESRRNPSPFESRTKKSGTWYVDWATKTENACGESLVRPGLVLRALERC